MKTYILREPKPVEPQKTIRSPRPKTTAPLTAAALLEGPAPDRHHSKISVHSNSFIKSFLVSLLTNIVEG
jgi:hypothetical protein